MCRADVAAPALASAAPGGKSAAAKPKWVKIYGRTVDVEKFRHPGGNIIELFQGMDGTTAFEAFHGHSKGAFKMLRALPTRDVDPSEIPEQPEAHVEEMSRLMVQWRERGLFKPRPIVSSLYGLCVVLTICAAVRFSASSRSASFWRNTAR